jgi:anaerobic magnesium-protoporphyrin IX monomethyl ester cyclase
VKTLLLFPPASDPAHPPLGIAALAGFLRAKGEQVDLLDLNLLSYEYLLDPRRIEACGRKIEHRISELEQLPQLDREQAVEYRLLASNALAAQYLRTALPTAMDDLRSSRIYEDRADYSQSALIVKRGMELVSAAYYPVRWYARGFSMGYRPTCSAEVLDAIDDRRQNLFLRFIKDCLAEWISSKPDVVGISLNYYCQLIPAMTIASQLRRAAPDTKIVIGGGLVCFYENRWEVLKPFSDILDAWIPYEGEIPLKNLLDALQAGNPVSSTPGVLSFENDTARMLPPPPPPVPSDLPLPDFEGLPLDRYLAPELILPILSSRGCYWGRCAFCSHDRLYRGRFRKKSPAAVILDLKSLADRYACRTFYITDEAIPPDTAVRIARAVSQELLSIKWFGEVRFEDAFDEETLRQLQAGGCGMLMFGMESAVQRVLDHMRKGTKPERIAAIIKACAKTGIRPFVMFFTGFPTETQAEATETIRFIESLHEYITHVAFTNFILEHHTPVHREPQAFGITEVLPYQGEELKIYSNYRVAAGMNADEAVVFLEDIRDRAHIAPLAKFFALSRSHLFFLPPKDRTQFPSKPAGLRDLTDPEKVFPIRRADLIPRTLGFDIETIGKPDSKKSHEIKTVRCDTNYAYSPQKDRLVNVGEHGLALLAPCDGRNSLADILASVGPDNRETVLNYYRDLSDRDLLTWEIRS